MNKPMLIGIIILSFTLSVVAQSLQFPSPETYTKENADKFHKTATNGLSPVYAPLAEWLVEKFQLKEKEGIGIDIGGGPGTLSVELARRTNRMFWINADINTFYIPHVFQCAKDADVAHRVGAVFADAQALPFRDHYADLVVSRGSFQFWKDKQLAFSEIYRVLKSGGVAFIGRGFSENLPIEVANQVRSRQTKSGGMPKYDVNDTIKELKIIMLALSINEYAIHRPKSPENENVNYGIWLEFHKK
ncbi:MAG: class I SAM-dependent methyltransferase [Candidatus Omnitrophota bacterium]|jgi:SAM-dependent methyltransferase|nr:MAG: class I SAM-dependent methyltransferase [Candidatus Omnitrophota bacterium]